MSAPPPPEVPSRAAPATTGPPPTVPRPPAPWWALLLTVAGVMLVVSLIAGVVAAFLLLAATSTGTETVRADEVSGVRLLGTSGDVVVTVEEDLRDSVVVDVATTTRWQEAEVRSETVDGVLAVEVVCEAAGGWGWTTCLGNYDVRVGPESAVAIDLVNGGVSGDGIGGDLAVDIVTGAASLTGLRSAEAVVTIANGAVTLAFAEPPTEVTATTNLGAIDVEVPDDGTRYAVNADVSAGGQEVGVEVDASAERRLQLSTGVGGVAVHYAGLDLGDVTDSWGEYQEVGPDPWDE